MNVFEETGGKWLDTEDSGKDYHVETVVEGLLKEHNKTILISKSNLTKLRAINEYMKSTVATFKEFEKYIIDNNIATKSDWKNRRKIESKLSTVFSELLVREGFDGIRY